MAELDPAIRMQQLLSKIASFAKPVRVEMATSSAAMTGLKINPSAFGFIVGFCQTKPAPAGCFCVI
jgi:hypothetical protein